MSYRDTPQNGVVALKKLPDSPLRYRVSASFVFGGISLFLFGVIFALMRQADRAAANQTWAWVVIAALIAVIGATGAFCGLIAWGALSDPTSRLGAWARKKPLADAVQHFLVEAAMCVLLLFVLWLLGIKEF
jgi:hypothetical protein